MNGKILRSRALALTILTLTALAAAGPLAAAARAGGPPLPGGPALAAVGATGGLAAQATPSTAAPTTAATAVASATSAASPTAAATPTGAASPTAAATATSAATAASTAAASPTATATGAATAAASATATASPATTAAASPTAGGPATTTATLVPSPTPPPTATVPVATSTAVMIVTPSAAAASAAAAADVSPYMSGVAPSLQYYNGPNAQYPLDWYLQRHLGNPSQFTMYRTEPLGLCNTYYYQYQGVYYCYTGGAAAAVPAVFNPGMAVVPPSVLSPGVVPPGMVAGVVPGMIGGVVQTPSGYAVQSAWANVGPQYQYYYGPNYDYEYDWYYQRHLAHPALYQVYGYDPGSNCATYSYRYQDRYYCYTGGSVGAVPPSSFVPPPGVALDPALAYSLQAYWGQVDPSYWYYYGPDYQYDDTWYQQRHLGNPLLYQEYAFDPGPDCATYDYQYQGLYYCYRGLYNFAAADTTWTVPVRYWSQVDPAYRYYYGPDYQYDDAWYLQRHLSYPDLFQTYDAAPGSQCGTYDYQYQGLYYCYTGN